MIDKNTRLILVILSLFSFACETDNVPHQESEIWFEYPGKYWNSQALHLGNGFFGASFLGGVEEETISITDASMWTGEPARGNWEAAGVNPKAKKSLPEIRKAVIEGNIELADSLTNDDFLGGMELFGHFSSIGDIKITFPTISGQYTDYKRALDLSNALGKVDYTVGGTHFSREYFCSYPDKVLVLRYKADTQGEINIDVGIEVKHELISLNINENEMEVNGRIDGNTRPFHVLIKAVNRGGSVTDNADVLSVTDADAVELYITMGTNYKMEYPDYIGEHPEKQNREVLKAATSKSYEDLKNRHVQDYKSLYDRVNLEIEHNQSLSSLPTNKRFERLRAGKIDTGYKLLAFNLGRYMIISASRPGTLPANLQGVWNAFYTPPWTGNYQSNVNLQEIYWSCGPLNLMECHEPYVNWIENLSVSGTAIAREVYGTNGWISHTIGNIWGHAAPVGSLIWGMYSMGSAWHCQHVWEHYLFTQDKDYLKETAYPILKGASTFWQENLISYEDILIVSPSVSAEHGALMTENGLNPAFHDLKSDRYKFNLPGLAQDAQMLFDLFTNTAEAATILGNDQYADSLNVLKEKLMPMKVGKHGQLQEWYHDIDHPDCHHRHISHLYAVAPGKQIHPVKTPKLAEAAKKALDMRGDGRFMEQEVAAGGNWSRAHRMWAWTRLMDGERANKIMTGILTEQGFENVLTYQHAPYAGFDGPSLFVEPDSMHCNFQLDATAALPGCLVEMIVQSHLEEIILLPALPEEFATGKITGVRLRGGHIIDVMWKDGELVNAVLKGDFAIKPKILLFDTPIDVETDDRIEFIENI